jgi:membrane-associated protease RseP (regulator of RpoE activity)
MTTTRRLLSLALLAAAPTSLAIAQEDSVSSATTTEVRVERQAGGEGQGTRSRSVSVDMENGKPSRVVIDGEVIPLDRLRKTPDGYEVLGADGAVIERIGVKAQNEPGAKSTRKRVVVGGQAAGPNWTPRGGPAQREREARVQVGGEPQGPPPKSMIGAGLGGVSEELAHHLGLESAAAAKATMLTSVMEDLPAGVAGLERFDVIVSVNGTDNASPDALREALRNAEPGSKVTLGVRRGAETKTVECTVAAFDGAKLATMEPIQVEGFEVGDFGVEGFDARDFLVPGMPMDAIAVPPMEGVVESEVQYEPGKGEAMGFFIGPDGQRREFRVPMPPVPPVPPAPRARAGGDRAQAEAMERMLSELNRRMDMLNDRLDAPRMQRENAQPNERGEPRGRGPGAENAEVNERLRRLEERLDAVMRELERANAERGPRR